MLELGVRRRLFAKLHLVILILEALPYRLTFLKVPGSGFYLHPLLTRPCASFLPGSMQLK